MTFLFSVQSSSWSLRLADTFMTEHNLIECLQCMPSLVELGLGDFPGWGPITDQVYDRLTYRGTGADSFRLCPKLEIICMLGGQSAYTDQLIVDMVKS